MSPRRVGPGAAPATRPGPVTIDTLTAHPPLRLDDAEAASRGVVRVALDAVHALPLYRSLRDDEETRSDLRLDHVAGSLARRTASAHVARLVAGGDYSLSHIPF